MLFVGNNTGASDIFSSSQTGGHSWTVSNLPTDRSTLYVRLWSLVSGTWYNPPQDYTYTANPAGVLVPVIAPKAGTYKKKVTINIATGTPGATIYYTTNGMNPTTSSNMFTGPFTIKQKGTKTVKAKAVKPGIPDSSIVSVVYKIK